MGQSTSVTLERHRHSRQVSPKAPSASLEKGQTVFLVQLCLAVLDQDLVRKEQCTCVCAKITAVPLLSETTKREDGFLNIARMGQHSGCPSFCKFECHQTPSVTLEGSSTRCVESRIWHRCSVLDTGSDMREAVHHCQEANTLHLSPCGTHGIDCHSSQCHDPTFLHCTKELQSYSTSVKDTTGSRLFRKTDSFPPRRPDCLGLCLSWCFCPYFELSLLLLFELSHAPLPGLQQSFTQGPVLPQFLHVWMSVLLVLFARVHF